MLARYIFKPFPILEEVLITQLNFNVCKSLFEFFELGPKSIISHGSYRVRKRRLRVWLADGFEFLEDVADPLLGAGGSSGFPGGSSGLLGEPFLEALYTTLGIQKFLGPGEEWVARGTNIDVGEVETGRPYLVYSAARTLYGAHFIFRMDICFHEGWIIALRGVCARVIFESR